MVARQLWSVMRAAQNPQSAGVVNGKGNVLKAKLAFRGETLQVRRSNNECCCKALLQEVRESVAM